MNDRSTDDRPQVVLAVSGRATRYSCLMTMAQPGVQHNPAIDVASLDIVTSTAGLAGFIGACALALERIEEAEAVFTEGLAEAVSVGRFSGLAAVRALQEQVEESCRLLTEALEMAASAIFPRGSGALKVCVCATSIGGPTILQCGNLMSSSGWPDS